MRSMTPTHHRAGSQTTMAFLASSPRQQRFVVRYRLRANTCAAFRFVEQHHLSQVRLDRLLGLAIEKTIAQQLDLFFHIDDMYRVNLPDLRLLRMGSVTFKQHLLEQHRIIKKLIGQGNHGPDYTGSGNKTGGKPDEDSCARGRNRRPVQSRKS